MKCRFQSTLLISALTIFILPFSNAQKAKLAIQLSNDRFQLNDTLYFVVTYLLGDKKLPPATLALVIKENNGDGIWQLRWPLINGHAEASLFFPPNIKNGNYTLYFAVQPRFFQVRGQVLFPPDAQKINATISSPSIIAKDYKLPVVNGVFKIDEPIFNNSAMLQLNISNRKKLPAIKIEAPLDSVFEPAAAISKEIIIGMGESSIMENKKIDNWIAYFDPFYETTTLIKNMPAAQQFDSVYVPVAFRKNIVHQYNFLPDSGLIKSGSLESFFQKKFRDFEIAATYSRKKIVMANSDIFQFIFYLDGQPATYIDLDNIRLADIATIKIISPGKNSAAVYQKDYKLIIALYSKQGKFCTQDYYRYRYLINGYQPFIYQLPPSPKMFIANPN